MLNLRRVVVSACLLLPLSACATAVDVGGVGTGIDGDASFPDVHLLDGGVDSSTPGSDTGSRSDSITTGIDTKSSTDTEGSGTDTYVEDTYVEDTYVEPVDTYVPPTGGPCDWCAEGSCDVVDEDFDCFYKCVFLEGHWDCRYDKSSSPVCTCTD